MTPPTRRHFLRATAAAALAGPAVAIDPIRRPGPKADLKLSLAAYSFRVALDLKKPTMTLFDFIDLAAGLPLDGVELTSYYFAETSDAYLDKLRAACAAKKLAVSGVPIRSDFCVADEAKRRADIESTKAWIGRAARLGAQTVRIFAGAVPKGDTLEAAQKRMVAALEEVCPVAEKAGVLLGVENHGGITDTPEHLLALVKPVNSPALGVNVDTGNFRTPDPYADVAKIAPYGVSVQVKTEVSPNGKVEEADLGRFVKILREANYHGFVALEYEAKGDPKTEVPKHVKELRALIGG
jgi:sugar phosphate isomerase/epimerase